MTETTPDVELRRFLGMLFESGDVLEVRAPKCRERVGSSFTSTVSGYFSDLDAAADAIARLEASGLAPGIYVTLNPVRSDLLARAANRVRPKAAQTTADGDVPRRRWLLVDVDPARPSGVSATDEELKLAEERAESVRAYLDQIGWPAPINAMSGNGHHLLYRVDLPGDDGGLVKRVLAAMADQFSDDAVSVDRSVFNPARIVKAVGTVARKGDDLRGQSGIADRPHRRSVLLDAPDTVEPVSQEQLESLAGEPPPPRAQSAHSDSRFPTDPAGVRAWLEARGVTVAGERRNSDKTMLLLERCPVDPEIVSTGGSDIAVLIGDDGKLAYCNKHNRGQGYQWHDLRRAVDPDYAARPSPDPGVDLSGLLGSTAVSAGVDPRRPASLAPARDDPGVIPDDALRVPGFISELMDFCLETAPYPNPVMAFCGALALQAFLAGRKVRDPGDNRTNLYLLGLAHSSAGKDWPRKLNTRIVHAVGHERCLGDRLASGEGVQDALFADPAMLFQTDEIDGMLQSINRARDARHESIMNTLLTLYSSSNSVFPMRRKAGREAPGVIHQPCLVLLGTAIPNHYYEALSERMLTNGFFARMLIFEAGQRSAGQEPSIREIPARVIETAQWWADLRTGPGNLGSSHPSPRIVEHTDEARRLVVEVREEAEAEYAKAEAAQDPVGTTVWGRVSEHVRKLALVYAISEGHRSPVIGADAVRWAARLVMHQTRRMLCMAERHVAENPFHAECLRLTKKLRESPNQRLPHSVLLKRMKLKAKDFRDLIETLAQRGDVLVKTTPRAGSSLVEYELIGGADEG